MTAARHTPGPWRAEPAAGFGRAYGDPCALLVTDGYNPILVPSGAYSVTEHDAQVRLAAAAPDLLAALRRLYDESYGGGTPCPLTFEHARAALARAEAAR